MNRKVAYAKNPVQYFARLSVRILYAVLLWYQRISPILRNSGDTQSMYTEPKHVLQLLASDKFLVNKTNRRTEFQFYWFYYSTCFGQPFCPSSGVLSCTSALVYFMQFWWPFATRSRMELQPFCPSSGVLSCTLASVHFMQIWWPFATRSRKELQFHPTPGSKRS